MQFAAFIVLSVMFCYQVWTSQPVARVVGRLRGRGEGRKPPIRVVWQSTIFANGIQQQTLPIWLEPDLLNSKANVSGVQAALRMATIEPPDDTLYSSYAYRDQNMTLIHLRLDMWDMPLASTWGFERSVLEHDFTYALTLYRPSVMSEPIHVTHCHPIWDVLCQIPMSAVRLTTMDDILSATLHVSYRDRVLANYDFTMKPVALPQSNMALCHKAIYGTPNYAAILEWREHHRMMGFDIVHWSSRSSDFGKTVEKINRITGGRDTFDWIPVLNTTESGEEVSPWYDGWRTMDQCYVTYRYAHDFIGVWDHDEFFAPVADLPWEKSTVDEWKQQWMGPERVGSVLIPFSWLDGNRFTKIPSIELREHEPRLSDIDLQHLTQIKINRNGYFKTGTPDIMQWFKGLHNTRWIRHIGIHQDADRDLDAIQIRNDTSFTIWHARSDVTYLDVSNFTPFPITKTVIRHWLALWQRWHDLLQKP